MNIGLVWLMDLDVCYAFHEVGILFLSRKPDCNGLADRQRIWPQARDFDASRRWSDEELKSLQVDGNIQSS